MDMPHGVMDALLCSMYLLILWNVVNHFEACRLNTIYLVNNTSHSACTSLSEYALTLFFSASVFDVQRWAY